MRSPLRAKIRRRLSFWTGALSVLDLEGRVRDELRRGTPADDAANLASDWAAVGGDIESATEQYREKLRQPAG
jgi:hypothetical protein